MITVFKIALGIVAGYAAIIVCMFISGFVYAVITEVLEQKKRKRRKAEADRTINRTYNHKDLT